MKLKLSSPDITERELEIANKILRSGNLSGGEFTRKFENTFAKYLGVKYAVAVNSGTSGLHLAINSLDITEGDEVITTPFSFIASANSILYTGAKPVFVDIDPNTYNIDVKKIEDKITSKTKAILPVHIFGNATEMKEILNLGKKYNLKIIEDACEALGTRWKNSFVGGVGDVGVFGFYPNKQITTGEGGMVVTNDYLTYQRCKSMRNQGRDGSEWLNHQRLGYNYRLSEISSGIGLIQMERIEQLLDKRRKVAKQYNNSLRYLEAKIKTPNFSEDKSWFVYVIEVSRNRDSVMDYLHSYNIPCKPYFPPIHLQPYYVERFGFNVGDYPCAETLSEKVLALPFHGGLKINEINFIVKKLGEALELYE